jgi:hypothetical protein
MLGLRYKYGALDRAFTFGETSALAHTAIQEVQYYTCPTTVCAVLSL